MSAVIDRPTEAPSAESRRLRTRTRLLTVAVVVLAACLVAVVAWAVSDRDGESAGRYEKARATQQAVIDITADPSAYGSEEEVLDLLDGLATPDVVSGDLAFGEPTTGIWRRGWQNTLFGGTDATLHTWTRWLSDDGSVGGSLWTWSGTARNGEPFDLQGLELSRFDDDGLYTELVMLYPYEDDEVWRRLAEGN